MSDFRDVCGQVSPEHLRLVEANAVRHGDDHVSQAAVESGGDLLQGSPGEFLLGFDALGDGGVEAADIGQNGRGDGGCRLTGNNDGA